MVAVNLNFDPAAVGEHAGVDNFGGADGVDASCFVDMTGQAELGLLFLNEGANGAAADMAVVR